MTVLIFAVTMLFGVPGVKAQETGFAELYKQKPKQTIRIWNESGGKRERAKVSSIVLSADGKLLLVGDSKGTVTLWELDQKKVLWSKLAHDKKAPEVGFMKNGDWAVSVAADGKLKVFDAKTGDEIATVSLDSREGGRSVDFHRSALQLVTGSFGQNKAQLMTLNSDDANLDDVIELALEPEDKLSRVALSPDRKQVAVSNWRKTIRLFNVDDPDRPKELSVENGEATVLIFSSQGLLASGHDLHDKRVRLWDLSTGKALKTIGEYTEGVNALQFSPDGSHLFAAGSQQTYNLANFTPVDIWDVSTGTVVQSLKLPILGRPRISLQVSSLAVSADGKRLVLAIWDSGEGYSIPSDPTPALFVFDFE